MEKYLEDLDFEETFIVGNNQKELSIFNTYELRKILHFYLIIDKSEYVDCSKYSKDECIKKIIDLDCEDIIIVDKYLLEKRVEKLIDRLEYMFRYVDREGINEVYFCDKELFEKKFLEMKKFMCKPYYYDENGNRVE